jgi:hypothetical protein
MTRINSQILWGTSYLNVLRLGRPVYDVVTGRDPREGSEWAETTAGVRDSWIVGRDYTMDFSLRWIPDGGDGSTYAPWSGPLGVQAFLDWARDSNTFRFVPDDTYPTAYVDGCYLADPFNGSGGLDALIRRTMQLRIINPTVDFQMALRGILLEYVPGASLTDPITHTVTRATVANYRDVDGNAAQAASGALRDKHYVGTVRTTLLEQARSNLLDNGDFESDIVGANANLSTIVSSSAFARYGTKSLKVTTTNVAFSGAYFTKRAGTRVVAAPADRITSDVWVYAPAASVGKTIQLSLVWYNAGAGVISTSTQTAAALVAGWNRYSYTATAPALTAFVTPTVYTDTGQGIFDFYIDLVTVQVGYFATSEIPTSTVVATRNADQLDLILPRGYKPGKYTMLIRMLPEWPRGVTTSIGSGTPTFALLQKSGGSPHVGIYLNESTSKLYGNVSDDSGTNMGDFGDTEAPAGSSVVDLVLQVDDAALRAGFAINATPSLGSITGNSTGLFDRLTLYGYGHGVTMVRLMSGLRSYADIVAA